METHPDRQPQAPNKAAATQLNHDKEKIQILWEKRVREKVGSAEAQTSIALLNSIEIFLDELITALEHSSLGSPYDPGKKGMSKMHGGERAKFAGYYLPQLLLEFSILREVLIEDLHKANALPFEVELIINSAIDSAISLAATEFAKVQQASLTTSLQKAEVSNKGLEEFAAVAAHDLKSPLATITGFLDLLRSDMGESLNEDSRKYLTAMENACDRMRNLVDHLLDYARLANRNREFEIVDLQTAFDSVLLNLHEAITKSQAVITCDPLPKVYGDAQMLSQVFQNIIANSLKFHGNDIPKITIQCHVDQEFVHFSIKDNGIGFDPQYKEHIFDLYKKLQSDDKNQGVGIGLATCKKVIELHGGRIWAESEPGKGSTFHFTLPHQPVTKTAIHH